MRGTALPPCRVVLLALSLLFCFAQTAVAGVESLVVGGRFMQDYIWWNYLDTDLDLEQENGTEVRRARLFAKGDVYGFAKFKLQFDFATGDADLKDAYLDFTKVPAVGGLRVGHYKEPFLLDVLTSSRYITFVERSVAVVFAPERDSGVMIHGALPTGGTTWAAGVFNVVDDYGIAQGASLGSALSARVTQLFLGENGSDRLLHGGAGIVYLKPDDGMMRYRARPEVHMSDRIVDTGEFPAESALHWNLEVAGVLGPVHFQGEYVAATATAPRDSLPSDPSFSGWYAQVGWFITGEARSYKNGVWGRTKPTTWFREGGAGAVEVAVRYSSLNLNDKAAGIEGGQVDDITVGLNWYIHPNSRFMLDYITAALRDIDDRKVGDGGVFVARVQFDF